MNNQMTDAGSGEPLVSFINDLKFKIYIIYF